MFVALKGSFSSENKSSFKRHFVIKHLLNHYSTLHIWDYCVNLFFFWYHSINQVNLSMSFYLSIYLSILSILYTLYLYSLSSYKKGINKIREIGTN